MRTHSPFTFFFILLSLLVVAICLGLRANNTTLFSARQGVLDLQGYDLDQQPTVEFGGEWELFWQRQLEPKDFQQAVAPTPDGFLTLPGSWKGLHVGGQTLDGKGFATLRLKILADPAQSLQALRIAGVYSAYRLWINGRLVAESGLVGTTNADEVMDHSLRLTPILVDRTPLEIVFQVSSFHMNNTALPFFQLGRHANLNATQNRIWGLALFSAGTLLLMGIYHIALFVLYRPNRSPLYFGIYCLAWMAFIVSNTTSDWSIRIFFPDLPGELLYRSSVFYYAMAVPLSYHIFRSLYPQEFPRWLLNVFWGLGATYAVVAIAGPTPISSAILSPFHLVVAAKSCFFLWALSLATKRKREGAAIVLTGFVVMCMLSFNDIFSSMNLIRSHRIMHVGMLFFMLAQSFALAQRFAGLFFKVEKLSIGLSEQNQSLAREIAERTRLQQEIVSISEDERRQISHELHDGLCQQLTGARLQSTVLESKSLDEKARASGQARLSKLLTESVDHAYKLSRGLWLLGPDSDNVCVTLTALAQSQSESSGIPIRVELRTACKKCAAKNGTQLFCIAREAIVNAVKHAGAKQIGVSLDCHDARSATLCVSDNGVGRSSTKKRTGGLGLRIMAYRSQMVGGSFRIEDCEGGGTRVTCSIPCCPSTSSGSDIS
jgi:signal transduction histidine kinase